MPVPRSLAALGAGAVAGVLSLALAACVPEGSAPVETPVSSVTPSPEPSATLNASATPSATPSAPGTSPEASTVTVTVITADVADGALEVTAMVDIVESGGTCTAQAVKGATRRAATGTATPTHTSTYCELMTVPVAELAPGEWTITVSYQSALNSGVSSEVTVDIP
ncbi:MAG TPA: hypothetical protein PKH61_01885 [Microbacteriaceae bacterium]|jgi:hypothetical protein|nr:hypothetical protein [Actinomycetota bacterium]HOA86138.1 hypothetical protein [Microbacteriaceae bacterium]HPZ34600.1 hypothetical protein [Microbacteriaceae bacterium]HQE46573.1 hypothetical protein [Rhodoglobus sp.]